MYRQLCSGGLRTSWLRKLPDQKEKASRIRTKSYRLQNWGESGQNQPRGQKRVLKEQTQTGEEPLRVEGLHAEESIVCKGQMYSFSQETEGVLGELPYMNFENSQEQ